MMRDVAEAVNTCRPVIGYLTTIAIVCGMGESRCKKERKENTSYHKWSFAKQAFSVVGISVFVNILTLL